MGTARMLPRSYPDAVACIIRRLLGFSSRDIKDGGKNGVVCLCRLLSRRRVSCERHSPFRSGHFWTPLSVAVRLSARQGRIVGDGQRSLGCSQLGNRIPAGCSRGGFSCPSIQLHPHARYGRIVDVHNAGDDVWQGLRRPMISRNRRQPSEGLHSLS